MVEDHEIQICWEGNDPASIVTTNQRSTTGEFIDYRGTNNPNIAGI
jgi:hypothetical protein